MVVWHLNVFCLFSVNNETMIEKSLTTEKKGTFTKKEK